MGGPHLGVGAVANRDGELLLVRRGRPPAAGTWAVPGGRLEHGEILAEAVVRELAEETGLDGVCGPLVGIAEGVWDGEHWVILDYEVTVLDPAQPLRPGDDAAEARWVPHHEVSELDLVEGLAEFLYDHGIVRGHA